jgi:hypothetical protein
MYYIKNGLGDNWKWLAVLFALKSGLITFKCLGHAPGHFFARIPE